MAEKRDQITNNRANVWRSLAESTEDEQTRLEALSAEYQQEAKQRNRYTRRTVLGGLAAVMGMGLTATVAASCSTSPPLNATPTASVTTRPFNVYTDAGDLGNHYTPSGFMGDIKTIKMTENWTENPHSGKTCIQVVYSGIATQGQRWAGVYWQHPIGNWGQVPPGNITNPTGYNLSPYSKLSFWVRGELGNEQIQFLVGGVGGIESLIVEPYPDSLQPVVKTPVIPLTTDWQPQSISLIRDKLTYIIGGFGWVANNTNNPKGVTFYVDDIVYSA